MGQNEYSEYGYRSPERAGRRERQTEEWHAGPRARSPVRLRPSPSRSRSRDRDRGNSGAAASEAEHKKARVEPVEKARRPGSKFGEGAPTAAPAASTPAAA